MNCVAVAAWCQGDFVQVTRTLRGDAAMSTLFGHRKGAFTGEAADVPVC